MKFQKLIALLVILVCLLLLTDAYVLPRTSQTATVTDLYSTLTSTKRDSYYNYFFVTDKQQRCEIFWQTYNDLKIGDPVVIQYSPVLNIPKVLYYHKQNCIYKKELGHTSNNTVEKYGLFVCLALSAIGLVDSFFPASQHKETIVFFLYLATVFSLMISIITLVDGK